MIARIIGKESSIKNAINIALHLLYIDIIEAPK